MGSEGGAWEGGGFIRPGEGAGRLPGSVIPYGASLNALGLCMLQDQQPDRPLFYKVLLHFMLGRQVSQVSPTVPSPAFLPQGS